MSNGFTLTTRFWFTDTMNYGPYAENNWHFSVSGDHTTPLADLADHASHAVISFWNDSPLTDATRLSGYLSGMLSGAVDTWFVDWEDSTNTSQPLDSWTLASLGTGPNLPSEVACAVTWKCDPYGGHKRQSFYNRIFLGPLVQMAGTGTGASPSRPPATFRDDVSAAYTKFTDTLDVLFIDEVRHAVYSSKHDSSGLVTSGWIDNAWDTIRRRGIDPTVKTALVIP